MCFLIMNIRTEGHIALQHGTAVVNYKENHTFSVAAYAL